MKMKELSELIKEYQDIHAEISMHLDQLEKLEDQAGEISAVIDYRVKTEITRQSITDI